MAYYIDLFKIDLNDYQNSLIEADLLPSRRILKEKMTERFEAFSTKGIKNLGELRLLLTSKKGYSGLLLNPVFSEEYLKILLREINSMIPKPNKLKDFRSIGQDTLTKLEIEGIKDTLKLYDHIKTRDTRKKFGKRSELTSNELTKMASLTDLSRIKWVSALFAEILLECDIYSSEILSNTDPVFLHQKISELNKDKQYFKGNIGKHDIVLIVESAKNVSHDVEF